MVLGPSGPFANIPPVIEVEVNFILDIIHQARRRKDNRGRASCAGDLGRAVQLDLGRADPFQGRLCVISSPPLAFTSLITAQLLSLDLWCECRKDGHGAILPRRDRSVRRPAPRGREERLRRPDDQVNEMSNTTILSLYALTT